MSVIFTGFAPWAQHTSNPSWDCLAAFTQAKCLKLPVTWNAADTCLLPYIAPELRAVVLFGLAADRQWISVETQAFNARDTTLRDAHGHPPPNPTIIPEAPAVLPATADTQTLCAALNNAGLPTRLSDDAGRFLCNESLFKTLCFARQHKRALQAVFIHVPPHDCLTAAQWQALPQTVHAFCQSTL